jgi:hypothetical protein
MWMRIYNTEDYSGVCIADSKTAHHLSAIGLILRGCLDAKTFGIWLL